MPRQRKIVVNIVQSQKVKTSFKNDKLAVGDFLYHLGHTSNNSKIYYCEWRYRHDIHCKGSIRVINSTGKLALRSPHNHAPLAGNKDAQVLKGKMIKESRAHPLQDPRVVISQLTKEVPAEVLNLMPKDLSRKVRKAKESGGFFIPSPTSIHDIKIDRIAQFKTNQNEPLLYHDTGIINGTRALIFATAKDLEVLKTCTVLAFDGTFDSSPRVFKQLWTIHGKVGEKFVPLVFALASHKTRDCYIRILQALPELTRLQYTISDFELPALQAISIVYPRVLIFGCHFHYEKCLTAKIKRLGWNKTKDGFEDLVFQKCLRRFFYLGFSKVEDVVDCFEILMEELESCNVASEQSLLNFRSYMETVWVGRMINGNYMSPQYEIRVWNTYLSTASIGVRTNNSIEAWNLAFDRTVNCKGKPGLPRFLAALKTEHDHIRTKLTENRLSQPVTLSNKEVQIRDILARYNEFDSDACSYFDAIAQAFRSE